LADRFVDGVIGSEESVRAEPKPRVPKTRESRGAHRRLSAHSGPPAREPLRRQIHAEPDDRVRRRP
jgi:hypothetical protein